MPVEGSQELSMDEFKEILELNGTRTLVTGASGGFGSAVVKLLVDCGQEVIAIKRRSNSTDKLKLKNLEVIRLDLTDAKEVAEFASHTLAFDNVICCHGISGLRLIPMLTPDFVENVFANNFKSKVNLLSSLIKRKKINNPGRIVNVSSISAHYGSSVVPIYSASHAATEAFMRSLAKSLLHKGVTVNSVATNAIWTPIFSGVENSKDNKIFDAPLGRGVPDDVARAIYFLCQKGSTYITGETLMLTGGKIVFDD
jgi:3-oxoacyl-[acyl-carrier protein] reductase